MPAGGHCAPWGTSEFTLTGLGSIKENFEQDIKLFDSFFKPLKDHFG